MIRFEVKPHIGGRDAEMVEVWIGDQFVGALYPGDREDELKFISKHLMGGAIDDGYPATLHIVLNLGGPRQ